MKKVLIVDDNTDFLEMLELMLSRTYEVVTCVSVPQVSELLPSFSPDVVLLDQHLREYHAEDVMGILVQHDLGKIPVLLITGSTNAEEEAGRLKCVGYLVKPFSHADLQRSLDHALAGVKA